MWKMAVSLMLALLVAVPASLPVVRAARPLSISEMSPAEVASYTIDADYDPDSHQITASQTVIYRNVTEAPIPDLVFHLYLNAFSSPETLWMREAGPQHRGHGFDPDAPGWIRVDEIRLAGGTDLTLSSIDDDETLVRSDLPVAVEPGESVVLEMAFTAQLPRVFARTGWGDGGDFVMAVQWFPKLVVWE